jgi:hypothetical protein
MRNLKICHTLCSSRLILTANCCKQLFQNILTSTELRFPQGALEELHPDCVDLCRSLLCRNPGTDYYGEIFVLVYVHMLGMSLHVGGVDYWWKGVFAPRFNRSFAYIFFFASIFFFCDFGSFWYADVINEF